MYGFCNVWVCICVGFVMCVCVGFVMCGCFDNAYLHLLRFVLFVLCFLIFSFTCIYFYLLLV